MLDETTMRPQLETLRRELHEREKEAARLQADLSALRNMVGGYELWLNIYHTRAQRTKGALCPPATSRRAAAFETAQAATATLPPVVGSEKQVAWAITIRADLLALARAAIAEFDGEMHAEGRARVARGLEALERTREAKWWIDHRLPPESDPQVARLRMLKLLAQGGGNS